MRNPYSVLGVGPQATTAELRSAHRDGLEKAASAKAASDLEWAFGILRDPQRRRRADQILAKANEAGKPGRAMASLALVLVVGLGIIVSALWPSGDVCPRCNDRSLVEEAGAEERTTLSCAAGACGFSFAYDPNADED